MPCPDTHEIAPPRHVWRKRLLAAGLAALTLASGYAIAQTKPDTGRLKVEKITVEARPIAAFERDGSERKTYGKLEWRGGLVLTSPSANFGGWSGLAFDPSGKRFVAISDAGAWMSGELVYDGKHPKAVASAKIGPLRARDGGTLRYRRDRDAEAVALEEGTLEAGSVLIAFEQNGRIGRFSVSKGEIGAPAKYLEIPPEVRALRRDGFESVTVMRGGKYKGAMVAFAEIPLRGSIDRAGWIWIDGKPQRFTFKDMGGFEVTDTASLSDGSLLVLERRFTWSEGVRMRLRLVEAGDLKPGALIKGEVLIAADMGQEIDNMEGLAVREKDGEAVITMISDDNFNKFLQRTVLLEFALPRGGAKQAARAETAGRDQP